MRRLFVAIRPPRPIRERLLALMGGVGGARWQNDGQLHLTLRFIGETDRRRATDIEAALGAIRHPAFAIALSGGGSFDRRGRPDTLWAGVAPHQPLKALHDKVDRALASAGIAPDNRAYLPHITLARGARAHPGPLEGFVSGLGGLSSPAFEIRAFCLFESRLGSEGAVYSIVERYDFA